MDYKIRYTKVHSAVINNIIHPSDQELADRHEWFARLELSILRTGFRNPVVLTAKDGVLTPRYGGSRIMIAQKYGLVVPAIVADFSNMFPDAPEISYWDIWTYYKDPPKNIILKPHGINMSGCADAHMENENES